MTARSVPHKIVLDRQPEGGYTATVPALPGCISEGDTKAEAKRNIHDAIQGWLKTYHKRTRRERAGP